MGDEMFVGGFASGFLAKGLLHVGYGLYFTTARMIGIDVGKNGAGALGGTMAGFIQGQLIAKLLQGDNGRTIASLDKMKDFEFSKDQISIMEDLNVGSSGIGFTLLG